MAGSLAEEVRAAVEARGAVSYDVLRTASTTFAKGPRQPESRDQAIAAARQYLDFLRRAVGTDNDALLIKLALSMPKGPRCDALSGALLHPQDDTVESAVPAGEWEGGGGGPTGRGGGRPGASFVDAQGGVEVRLDAADGGVVVSTGSLTTPALQRAHYDAAKGTLSFPEVRKRLRLPQGQSAEERRALLGRLAEVMDAAGASHDLSARMDYPLATPVSSPARAPPPPPPPPPLPVAEMGPAERRRIARLKRLEEQDRIEVGGEPPAEVEEVEEVEEAPAPIHFPAANPPSPGYASMDDGGEPRREEEWVEEAEETVCETEYLDEEPVRVFEVTKGPTGKVGLTFAGTRVTKVVPEGPADLAGLRVGMEIRSIAGGVVNTHREVSDGFSAAPCFFSVMAAPPSGQPVRRPKQKPPASPPRERPAALPSTAHDWGAIGGSVPQPSQTQKEAKEEWPTPMQAKPTAGQGGAPAGTGVWQKSGTATAEHIRSAVDAAQQRRKAPREDARQKYLRELREMRGEPEPPPPPPPAAPPAPCPAPVVAPKPRPAAPVTEWNCRSCGTPNPLSSVACQLARCHAPRPSEFDAALQGPELQEHELPVVLEPEAGEELEDLLAELEAVCTAAASDPGSVVAISVGPPPQKKKQGEAGLVVAIALGRAEGYRLVRRREDASPASVSWTNPDTGDLLSFFGAEGGGMTYDVNGAEPRPPSRDVRWDPSGALDFADTGRGVSLPYQQDQQAELVSRIDALARSCGCSTDLPAELEAVARVYVVCCEVLQDAPDWLSTLLETAGDRIILADRARKQQKRSSVAFAVDSLRAAGVLRREPRPPWKEAPPSHEYAPAALQWHKRPLPVAVQQSAAGLAVAALKQSTGIAKASW
eukprot:Hpha_TRINITY_DN16103_c0_g2::TRINITY_DN16103_c0_g2_i1::g.7522::m.7522